MDGTNRPDPPEIELTRRVEHAGEWALAGQVVAQLFSLGVLAILYRHIGPRTYGIFAIALPVVVLCRSLATLSWHATLVQLRSLSSADATRAFWSSLWGSCAAMLACFFLGRFVASAVGVAQVSVVCSWLAITSPLAMLVGFAQALRQRRLDWSWLVQAGWIAQGVAGMAAVVVALAGGELSALIVQQLVEWGCLTVLLWSREGWRPNCMTWPWLPATWAWFQGFYLVAQVMFLVIQSADRMILGWAFGHSAIGQTALGHYSQAHQLSQRPVGVVAGAWGTVLLSGLANAIHTGQREIRRRMVAHFVYRSSLLLAPLMVGGWLVADDLVILFGGEAWRAAGPLLSVFSLTVVLQAWIQLAGNLFTARGAVAQMALGATIGGVVATTALSLLVANTRMEGSGVDNAATIGRITGMAPWVILGVTMLWGIPYLIWACHVAGLQAGDVAASAVGPVAVALVMGIAVAGLRALLPDETAPAIRLACLLPAGGVIYLTGIALWYRRRNKTTQRPLGIDRHHQ